MDSGAAPLTARRLSWADENSIALASTIPQAAFQEDAADEEDEEEHEDRPGERTMEMGIIRQGFAYRVAVELPSYGQLVEVVGPLPDGINLSVKDDGSPSHCAALWIDVELMQIGYFSHCLQVRIAGGVFSELLVHLKANVMGPREGRPSRVHEHVELIRGFSSEDVEENAEGQMFRKVSKGLAATMDEDDPDS
mmetsp:Transcript_107142/g.190362  ORF Transcript_107142/g.190362 Transcript_107142/m.190362 type:complete len:194 (+) Transcript_107142:69-650(+)